MMAWMLLAALLLATVFQQQLQESMEQLARVFVQTNVIQLPPTNVQVYVLEFTIYSYNIISCMMILSLHITSVFIFFLRSC